VNEEHASGAHAWRRIDGTGAVDRLDVEPNSTSISAFAASAIGSVTGIGKDEESDANFIVWGRNRCRHH
jgi:hypothetical protein